jgi:hypothetical protein
VAFACHVRVPVRGATYTFRACGTSRDAVTGPYRAWVSSAGVVRARKKLQIVKKRKRLRVSYSPPSRFDDGDRAPTSSRTVCIIRRSRDPGRDSRSSPACTLRVAFLTAFARRGSGRRPRMTRQLTDFGRRRTARRAVGSAALVLSALLRDAILLSLVTAPLPRLRKIRTLIKTNRTVCARVSLSLAACSRPVQ